MPQEPILESGAAEPIHVVPAFAPLEPVAAYEPTQVIPQVSYQAVGPPTIQPVAPVVAGPMFVEDRRPAWPYFVAVLALIVGGLVGFLISNGRDADTTTVASSTQPLDSTVSPTATLTDLQDQVALLTAAQTDAAQDLAEAQASLAQAQEERDALAAQVGTDGGTTGLQADLAATQAQVANLQTELDKTAAQLDTANASLSQAQASQKTLQGQLDAANATLAALHPAPLGNYVNGTITKARSDAQANGWTLIEEPGNSSSGAVGTVLEQIPAPGTTMVAGSVLHIKVK